MAENLEIIFNKYRDTVFRCAYRICNNRNDAEDIMQEVFYKYLSKKPDFKDEQHEKAWLLRVTINLSKNYVGSFWHNNVESIADNIPSVTQEEVTIWDTVHQLPMKYRIVIELHYLEGYTIKEIGVILQKKQSTIGTWLERGKKKLKKNLEVS